MAIYNVNGTSISSAYNLGGTELSDAFDVNGTSVYQGGGGDDYDHYDNEYQHTILLARNAWATEYRADPTVLPIVLTTDQHGSLGSSNGSQLYSYLALAVKWNECSASLNLGDVGEPTSGDNYSYLESADTTLSNISSAKRIDVIGNHDTWSSWCNDSTQNEPNAATWNSLNTYFDNSSYNGFVKLGTHQTAEYMVDATHGIKYVVLGAWDYDKTKGGYSHYNISSSNMDKMIQALGGVDNNDIVILSHIQPYKNQMQNDGTNRWYIPPVDGGSSGQSTTNLEAMVNIYDTSIDVLIDGRKRKTSGVVYDSYGNAHNFDFSNCTSDVICSLHGHQHSDLYNWQGGSNRDLPVVVFDAYHYDNMPFFFINIDRTKQRLNIWKVDKTPAIYNYQIPFTDPSV